MALAAIISATDVLREAWAFAQTRPHAQQRHMTLTIPWPLPGVMADRDQLFLLLYNLLDEGFRTSPPGDTLAIRVAKEGLDLMIELTHKSQNALDPRLPAGLRDLRSWREAPVPGNGLDLVRTMVEALGGQIAQCLDEDDRRRITIHLPLIQPA
jgi:signal transduction histidine kinase